MLLIISVLRVAASTAQLKKQFQLIPDPLKSKLGGRMKTEGKTPFPCTSRSGQSKAAALEMARGTPRPEQRGPLSPQSAREADALGLHCGSPAIEWCEFDPGP